MRISDWSSDVCSSDLPGHCPVPAGPGDQPAGRRPARCHGAGGPGMSGDTAMTSGPGEAPLLAVRDLYVDLPLEHGMLHAVRGISFAVKRGAPLCLVGQSGCGTSLNTLAVMGLLPPAAPRTPTRMPIHRNPTQQ